MAIYRYSDGRIKNALISYNTHIAAAMGRRRLVPDRTNLFPGVDLTIDWAHPKLTPYNVVNIFFLIFLFLYKYQKFMHEYGNFNFSSIYLCLWNNQMSLFIITNEILYIM